MCSCADSDFFPASRYLFILQLNTHLKLEQLSHFNLLCFFVCCQQLGSCRFLKTKSENAVIDTHKVTHCIKTSYFVFNCALNQHLFPTNEIRLTIFDAGEINANTTGTTYRLATLLCCDFVFFWRTGYM